MARDCEGGGLGGDGGGAGAGAGVVVDGGDKVILAGRQSLAGGGKLNGDRGAGGQGARERGLADEHGAGVEGARRGGVELHGGAGGEVGVAGVDDGDNPRAPAGFADDGPGKDGGGRQVAVDIHFVALVI